MAEAAARKKVTIPMLMEKKKKGEPIVQLAVYDYETAIIADRVGIDILCVSDTGGMVLFGHESTTSVSFEEVMFMAQAVKRGSQYGLRMVDMPYMSFHLSEQQAVDNAAKYVSQAGAEVMKCEGNQHHAKYIEAIVKAGIPVQGHIGICPMRIPQLGGFAAQGKTADRAKELVDDALAFVDAGCFSIMTEVVTSEVSEYLAKTLSVPVISLGSGNTSDGVHIIGSDLFHLYEKHTPRHSKIYCDLVPIIEKGLTDYRDDVRGRVYPGKEHTVFMKEDELKQVQGANRLEEVSVDGGLVDRARAQAPLRVRSPHFDARARLAAADRFRRRRADRCGRHRRSAPHSGAHGLRRVADPDGDGDGALHVHVHRHRRHRAVPAPRQHRLVASRARCC